MAPQKILAVGFEIANDEVKCVEFDQVISLLDWDIVLFRPSSNLFYSFEKHKGLSLLSENTSFSVKKICERWAKEIKSFTDHGKNIFIFLSELEDVYIFTGEAAYRGLSKNKIGIKELSPYSNYKDILPALKFEQANGSNVKLENQYSELLASYWKDFSSYSSYKVIIKSGIAKTCLATSTGSRPVGVIIANKMSNGSQILLPDLDFDNDRFFEKNKDSEYDWSEHAGIFAAKLIHSIVEINKTLVSKGQFTPEPIWAGNPEYSLSKSEEIRQKLALLDESIAKLESDRDAVFIELKESQVIKGLLYEKGKPLEVSILEALKILGFSAEPFHDADSEFDAVFESVEGRLIGEAEGKDNKQINIEKLRQLTTNIIEDSLREEVSSPAKGVLFGNGHRLTPLNERPETFTEKCLKSAISMNIALLSTKELFSAAQYLSNNSNEAYAALCRTTLLDNTGIISFPSPEGNS